MISLPSITTQLRALFRVDAGGADTWVDADRVVLDGTGTKTVSMVDYIDPTHVITQATTGLQTNTPVPWSAARNAQAFSLTGSQSYASNRSASAWTYLHNGSGMTTVCVAQQTTLSASPNLLDTLASLTTIGWRVRYRSATAQVSSTGVSNGAQGNVMAFADVAITGGPPDVHTVSHGSARSPNFLHRVNGVVARNVAYTNAGLLTSSAPTQTLTMMGPAAGGGVIGWFACAMFWRRVLTASELGIVATYLSMKYGAKL